MRKIQEEAGVPWRDDLHFPCLVPEDLGCFVSRNITRILASHFLHPMKEF